MREEAPLGPSPVPLWTTWATQALWVSVHEELIIETQSGAASSPISPAVFQASHHPVEAVPIFRE